MQFCCSTLLFLGRLCISAIFLLAGIGKFMDYEGTTQYMATRGLQFIPFLLVVAAVVEILSALSLIFGFKARVSAFILLLFLIPITYLFHDFWNAGPEIAQLQFIMFMKNVSIAGGLLYIIGAGSGGFAVDNCCSLRCRIQRKDNVAV